MRKTTIISISIVLNMVWGASAAFCAQAPSWVLNDLQGGERRLEEWRGKWILMKLGTTHCPNCSIELEEMAKIKSQIQALGVEVLDIYLREKKRSVERYLKKIEVDFQPTVLYDWRGSLVESYRVSIIPHLLLVDPDGEIMWQGEFTPAEELLKVLDSNIRARSAQAR